MLQKGPKFNWIIFHAIEFFSITILIIGCIALIGYITELEFLYKWSVTPMPLNSVIACICAGVTFFLLTILIQSLAAKQAILSQQLKRRYRHDQNKDTITDNDITIPTPLIKLQLQPIDIIAVISILGCFLLIVLDKTTDIIGILITVVSFYFGKAASGYLNHKNGNDEKVSDKNAKKE